MVRSGGVIRGNGGRPAGVSAPRLQVGEGDPRGIVHRLDRTAGARPPDEEYQQ
ncbi:hypothetical protein GCM10009830_05200 [Glycomyces endophyticus]|uniref:Uncharacterized protein n=1 Tax=Glycomyces endophyticus TaxID=480996 RepID=A0ABP4S0Z2_9ACTN